MSDGMKNYRLHLQQKEMRDGHNPGRLYIDGWKSPSKKTLVQMYRNGQITHAQTGKAQNSLKLEDHLEALKHSKVNENDLEALGIFVHRSSRRQKDSNTGRVVKKTTPTKGDWSRSPAEIQQIMREWEARQAAKRAAEAKGKKGFEPTLTKKEKSDMLIRHQSKGAMMPIK